MKKIYYLGTCSTCTRIINELQPGADFELQDIKKSPITGPQLTDMKKMAGSYESLFSRRSMKYRAWGLQEKELIEKDFRALILKEYTFLKRPVIITGNVISIGNSKSEIDKVRELI